MTPARPHGLEEAAAISSVRVSTPKTFEFAESAHNRICISYGENSWRYIRPAVVWMHSLLRPIRGTAGCIELGDV